MVYTGTEKLLIYIKQQMLSDKITIKELSIRLNRSQSATGQLLRQNNITLETLHEICKALNYTLEVSIIKDDTK